MFCNCQFCQKIRKMDSGEVRTRSQVLIDDILSVDFPPEAYVHSLKYGVNLSNLKYLLVTHSHMDHFYAHDFILRGYKYAQLEQDVLNIYGNEEVFKVFKECCAREMKEVVAPHIAFNTVKSYQVFKVGNYTVITIPANHSKVEDALLFYISDGKKGYLHLHDSGVVCDEAINFLAKNNAKADLVTFDCTFLDKSYGPEARHMGIDDNMAIKQRLKDVGVIDDNCKCVITHFSHNANPTRANLLLYEEKYGVIAAYDGLTIEI